MLAELYLAKQQGTSEQGVQEGALPCRVPMLSVAEEDVFMPIRTYIQLHRVGLSTKSSSLCISLVGMTVLNTEL